MDVKDGKSLLWKLPKEMLIEIIEKQNVIEHYTYKELNQLNKKIFKKQNEYRQIRDRKIKEKIIDMIPQNFPRVIEWPYSILDVNWKYTDLSVKGGSVKIDYAVTYLSKSYELLINFYLYERKVNTSFSERENGDFISGGNRNNLLELYPQFENLVHIMESTEILDYFNFKF
jgi:hypothetical protein